MGSGRLTVEDGWPDQERLPRVFRSSLICSQSESYKSGNAAPELTHRLLKKTGYLFGLPLATPMQTIPFPVSAVAFPLQRGVRELLENALDQALLIANTRGEVLFATRKTRIILQAFFAERSDDLVPNEIRTWLIK